MIKTKSCHLKIFYQDEWNRSFEDLEERYSFYDLVKSKRYKAELCTYLRSKTFLTYLLCNNFISEDYRFYVSKFSKQFSLNRREYFFLRKIYDTNSDYQPNYKLLNARLDILFSLLPRFTINSKAIFNISLFIFALKQYNDHKNIESSRFLGKYLEICLEPVYRYFCPEFLNKELLNKKELYLKDAGKINLLFMTIVDTCGSLATLTRKLSFFNRKSQFILYALVYGSFMFSNDGNFSESSREINDFVSTVRERKTLSDIVNKIIYSSILEYIFRFFVFFKNCNGRTS